MLTSDERSQLINNIRRLPDDLSACIAPLSEAELTTITIEGEWTVAQNVHHVADSHMNAYIRFKLLINEDHPTIRTYNQDDWAANPDARSANLEDSLTLIRGLHARWSTMLQGLDEAAWGRTGFHPEGGEIVLDDLLKTYGNYGHGHIDQIERTLAAGRK